MLLRWESMCLVLITVGLFALSSRLLATAGEVKAANVKSGDRVVTGAVLGKFCLSVGDCGVAFTSRIPIELIAFGNLLLSQRRWGV